MYVCADKVVLFELADRLCQYFLTATVTVNAKANSQHVDQVSTVVKGDSMQKEGEMLPPAIVRLLQDASLPELSWHRFKSHRSEELLGLLKHLLLVPALAEHLPGDVEVGLARVGLEDVANVAPLLGPPGLGYSHFSGYKLTL